jgi:hypothetical protein
MMVRCDERNDAEFICRRSLIDLRGHNLSLPYTIDMIASDIVSGGTRNTVQKCCGLW